MNAVFITLLICIAVVFILLLLKNDYIRYSKIEDYIEDIDLKIEGLEEDFPNERALIEHLKYFRKEAEKLF